MMKLYSLRLKPGQDLRKELVSFADDKGIKAGSIVTCVGALKKFTLRMAGATPDDQTIRAYEAPHEIVSLVGTLTGDDCHLHISLAAQDGTVIGGHLKENSIVEPTAEIVIAEDDSVVYKRVIDTQTGFPELVIDQRHETI